MVLRPNEIKILQILYEEPFTPTSYKFIRRYFEHPNHVYAHIKALKDVGLIKDAGKGYIELTINGALFIKIMQPRLPEHNGRPRP